MVQPVENQPAYVLHRRAYRESSALVELLTPDFGIVGAVVRGIKRARRTTHDIEPFGRIAVGWRGRGELVTVVRTESVARFRLTGDALFAGLYVNELTVKTLARGEPATGLFAVYEAAIGSLARLDVTTARECGGTTGESQRRQALEPILRTFERQLLEELGYGIAFDVDLANGRPIAPGRCYRVVDGEGFRETERSSASGSLHFDGGQIAAMAAGDFRDPVVLQGAKQVLRRAIASRLGGKPLTTRSLFARTRPAVHPESADRSLTPCHSPEDHAVPAPTPAKAG